MASNTVNLKLEKFEGPLDLLLHLIEKEKISLYDIPIAKITDQYMEYLNKMEELDMEITSEFLVMASTLLKIKSEMLLPKVKNDEGIEIDPRSELVERLLEYKMCRYISDELKDKQLDAGQMLYRKASLPEEVANYQEKVDINELLSDLTLPKLHEIFINVIKRQDDRIDPVRSGFGKIQQEEINLSDKIVNLQEFGLNKRKFTFCEYISMHPTKLNVIVSFLGVLELMKMGRVSIIQNELFDDFTIEYLADDVVKVDNTVITNDN